MREFVPKYFEKFKIEEDYENKRDCFNNFNLFYFWHINNTGNKDYVKLLSQIRVELYRTKESRLSSPRVVSLKNSEDLLQTTAALELLEVRPHNCSNTRAVQQAAVISLCASDCRSVGLRECNHVTFFTFIKEGNKERSLSDCGLHSTRQPPALSPPHVLSRHPDSAGSTGVIISSSSSARSDAAAREPGVGPAKGRGGRGHPTWPGPARPRRSGPRGSGGGRGGGDPAEPHTEPPAARPGRSCQRRRGAAPGARAPAGPPFVYGPAAGQRGAAPGGRRPRLAPPDSSSSSSGGSPVPVARQAGRRAREPALRLALFPCGALAAAAAALCSRRSASAGPARSARTAAGLPARPRSGRAPAGRARARHSQGQRVRGAGRGRRGRGRDGTGPECPDGACGLRGPCACAVAAAAAGLWGCVGFEGERWLRGSLACPVLPVREPACPAPGVTAFAAFLGLGAAAAGGGVGGGLSQRSCRVGSERTLSARRAHRWALGHCDDPPLKGREAPKIPKCALVETNDKSQRVRNQSGSFISKLRNIINVDIFCGRRRYSLGRLVC
ncbi:collagen, type I, alpha 1a-like [Pseudopipra pipra]|uniref:collagen, type I, alpha 1a-like n=1 Tax=Pseudopipra pipra TaxID=415032 RepID=UPI003139B091